MPLYVSKKARHRVPPVPLLGMAHMILGRNYELSITYITPVRMRSMNRKFRKKNASTDILSFAFGKNSGELYISMPDVEKKARTFGMTMREYFGYLAVHGMLHLRGHDHGKKMSLLERRFCKRFGIPHDKP
jgi:rRNA maturation RNase YbeY